jgi:carbonic anhydrase
MNAISRRRFIQSTALATGTAVGVGALSAFEPSAPAKTSPSLAPVATPSTPDQALARLKAGNARFARGHPLNQGRDSVRRAQLAESQAPYAVILGCSDSRVIPEILFDAGIGDLFLVRVAGNAAGTTNLVGSIEYSVAVLGSKLIFVLGHQNCGAVKAAVENVTEGKSVPGDMPAFVQPIIPAARTVTSLPKDEQVDAAIKQNVRLQVQTLPLQSSILENAVAHGEVKVVGGVYKLRSGRVELL